MRLRILILAAAMALTGCASEQLQFTSTRQMSSEPDIYVQQVMDNLSRIAADPTTLPYFNTLDSGVPQVTDKITLGGLLMYPAQSLVKQLHNQRGGQLGPLTGERDINVNWTIKPVNDEGRLKAMQGLYLWVLGRLEPAELCDAEKKIGGFYLGKDGKANFSFGQVEQGWFQCGRWHDKPKDACYVVHHHGTYCWVVPGHEKALTDLSLRMLRIALVAKRTKTVVRTYYNVEGRVAQTESTVEAVEKIVPVGTVVRPNVKAMKEKRIREILTEQLSQVLYIVENDRNLLPLLTECDRQKSHIACKSLEDVLKSKLTESATIQSLRNNEEIKKLIEPGLREDQRKALRKAAQQAVTAAEAHQKALLNPPKNVRVTQQEKDAAEKDVAAAIENMVTVHAPA